MTVGDVFRKVRNQVRERVKEEELKISEEEAFRMIAEFKIQPPEPEQTAAQKMMKQFSDKIGQEVKE